MKSSKHVGFVALMLLGVAGTATAQSDSWVQQAPWPTWFNLPGICMMSETEAWLVGSAQLTTNVGDVLHTTDGGVTWSKTELATSQFNAVYFLDANHGWIVGNDTYRTTNGGATWTHLNGNGTLEDVQFIDPLHGFACGNGGVVYRSTDGGATWIGTGISGGTHRSLFFLDAQRGWTVNIYGEIYHTTDGGLHWILQYDNPSASNLGSIQFFDANEGWAIGGNYFLHTIDGGTTWTRKPVPPDTWAWDAWFGDRDHGVAVGAGGNIVRTTDGGNTWNEVEPPTGRPDLLAVRMFGPSMGFYSGNAAMLYATEDGGATWRNRQSGGWAQTRTVFALDGDHAWAACDGGEVLRTTNGGLFWDRATPDGVDIYGTCFDVAFADANTGFVVLQNEFFGGNDEKVVRSLDSGQTWQIRAYFPDAFILDTVVAPSPTLVLIAGVDIVNGADLLRSTNGGATWTDVTPATSVWNLDFVSPQVGWLAGSQIMKTTDGGASWFTQHSDAFEYHDISFADASHGWAAASGEHAVHTTNGGQSWTVQNIGTAAAVWGVSAVTADECWMVLLNGAVRYTQDGGATWREETVTTQQLANLLTIGFTGPGTGWVAGNTGIYHRGQVPADVRDAPSSAGSVRLALPFPNPAIGPVTIRYQGLADIGSGAACEILDVTGRRVQALALGRGSIGPGEIIWDGKDAGGHRVPAGRYYLRVEGTQGKGVGITRLR